METQLFFTTHEAAEVLRVSQRTLERHRIAGSGPRFVKAGRRVLYPHFELDAWTASRTYGSTSEAQAAEAKS